MKDKEDVIHDSAAFRFFLESAVFLKTCNKYLRVFWENLSSATSDSKKNLNAIF